MNVNKTPIGSIQFINRVFGSKIQDRKFHDEELRSFPLFSYPISVNMTMRMRLMGNICRVYCSCHVCIVVILCIFVVLCVYCCFYFRCRTAG